MSSAEDKLKELLLANTEMQKCSANDANTPIDQFRNWFLLQFNESKEDECCKLDTFAVSFLNTLRQQTENHLRSIEIDQNQKTSKTAINSDNDGYINNIACTTPKRVPLCTQNSAPSTPNFASTPEQAWPTKDGFESSLGGGEDLQTNFRSTSKNASYANATSTPSMDRSLANTFKSDTSTPIRRNQNSNRRSGSNSLAMTPHSAEKVTPRNHSVSSSFCLGDFMTLQQSNSRSNRKKGMTNAQPHQMIVASTSSETSTNVKPKKRVVPTTISQRSIISSGGDLKHFGCSSSFSNENNILKLTNVEIEDKTKCSIMAARKSLKLNANEISKELETVNIADDEKNLRGMIERKLRDVTANVENKTLKAILLNKPLTPIELDKIKQPAIIQCLADIYVVLIDMNYVTNVLSEMAFILNLLNAEDTNAELSQNVVEDALNVVEESSMGMELLSNIRNCIYFALCVLKRQRHMFAQLDLKSLGVVLHNERIQYLDMDLKSYLENMYQHKQTLLLDKSQSIEVFATNDQSFKSVYYQEEKDSRQHFTSNNDFGAFKTQRDLFYKVLKLWETHHLNPNWNFTQELSLKIREIFKQSENPINMAHFAKLFVAQLLISASDATSPEDIGLDVDAEKFSKLSQRLVAPSNFSVDYQFPRNQAFFRDFIAEARSIPFVEQLKMALYHQLITLNNSTFEQLNLLNDQHDADDIDTAENDKSKISEFIVRPEILASMIILAKFLGFVTAYPYSQNMLSSITTGIIEKKQLTLRSLFQPHFSVSQHLLEAIKNKKMLITLPWLVQYLAMLDNITLQMEDFERTIQLLCAISTEIGFDLSSTSLLPLSIFIFRCCMGWLFDTKPLIAEKYFRYRAAYTRSFDIETQAHIVTIFRSTYCPKANEKSGNIASVVNDETLLNPILECLIPVACPFLAEFRVAIMPSKYATTKYVSRTGRYRHITTRIAEATSSIASTPMRSVHNTNLNVVDAQQSLQNKLTDAFLHSQNASMRRLIEFVTERVYKSVVKDGQHKYIMPSKASADKLVNEIKSSDADEVSSTVSAIYKNAHENALQQWDINLPQLLNERITNALNSLLPTETTPVIQRIYFKLVRQNAMKRIQQWFEDNLRRNNFYCGDLNEITQKICKANKKAQQNASLSELIIVQLEPCVSDLLDELQYWLHCTSIRTELLDIEPDSIIKFFQGIPETFANTLPTIFYRLIGTGLVQIMQNIIIHKPDWFTTPLLSAACTVWLHPKFESFTNTKKQIKKKQKPNINGTQSDKNVSDCVDDDDNDDDSSSSSLTDNQKTPSIYDGLITVAFIEALEGRCERFEKLKILLVYLIRHQVITLEKVDMLFLPIFKLNWPPNVLNEISKTLQLIAEENAQVGRKRNVGDANNDVEVLDAFSRDFNDFD